MRRVGCTALLLAWTGAACAGGSSPAPGADTLFAWDQVPYPDASGPTDVLPGTDPRSPPQDRVPGSDGLPADRGGHPPADAVADTAAGCPPGSSCWEDRWVIQLSKITFVVGGTAYNPDWYLLDALPPAQLDLPVEVRSTGMNPLNLVSVFLEEGSNPWVTLLWTGDVQPSDLPLELMPPGTSVQLTIRYQPPPGSTDGSPAWLTAWSGDPEHPSRTLKLPVRQPGPDIEATLNWSNYGCSAYCHARPFEIFNTGTEALVIQGASFAKASGEWSVAPAITPGLTLAAPGDPGNQTFAFEVSYCDADGSYGGDSNALHIASNDPDENPFVINLTVMEPGACPP